MYFFYFAFLSFVVGSYSSSLTPSRIPTSSPSQIPIISRLAPTNNPTSPCHHTKDLHVTDVDPYNLNLHNRINFTFSFLFWTQTHRPTGFKNISDVGRRCNLPNSDNACYLSEYCNNTFCYPRTTSVYIHYRPYTLSPTFQPTPITSLPPTVVSPSMSPSNFPTMSPSTSPTIEWHNTSEVKRSWSVIAMSKDGKIQTAGVEWGYLWNSNNFGKDWTQITNYSNVDLNSSLWSGIAMSDNGTIQTAITFKGAVWISDDNGKAWNNTVSEKFGHIGNGLTGVAMSSNGKYQTAVVDGGYIWTSDDIGVNWKKNEELGLLSWVDVAMSGNGSVQTVVVKGGNIWTSKNFGNTWTSVNNTNKNWIAVDMSDDGKYQTAIGSTSNLIYRSEDYGATWSNIHPIISVHGDDNNFIYPMSVAVSENGQRQTIGYLLGHIWQSTDSGISWTKTGPEGNWFGVAMNRDGTIQTAVDKGSYIWTYGQHNLLGGNENIFQFGYLITRETGFSITFDRLGTYTMSFQNYGKHKELRVIGDCTRSPTSSPSLLPTKLPSMSPTYSPSKSTFAPTILTVKVNRKTEMASSIAVGILMGGSILILGVLSLFHRCQKSQRKKEKQKNTKRIKF